MLDVKTTPKGIILSAAHLQKKVTCLVAIKIKKIFIPFQNLKYKTKLIQIFYGIPLRKIELILGFKNRKKSEN